MKNLSKKTISLMLVFVILMSTFLPTFASALNYDLPEWNETDHTVNSYNVTSDVVTLYVGNISVDGTSVLKYLYTDKSVNTATLTEIGKILTTDYAAILPTTEGQIAVSNDNTVTVQEFFTDAGVVGVNMYPDKTPTDTSATILYNQTVFNSLATASATEVSDEQTAEANNLSAYNTRKTAWEDAEQAKVAADSDYTPVAFPEEYKNAFNDTTSYPSDSYFIVDNKGSSTTDYIIRNGFVTQVNTYPINRTIVKVVNTSANLTTTPEIEEYKLWVGGVQVTSENKNNILGDGKVSFNPTTNTLNFDDATITNTKESELNGYQTHSTVLSYDMDLTVTGKAKFQTSSATLRYAIFCRFENDSNSGNLTLDGDFTSNAMFRSFGDMTIKSGNVISTNLIFIGNQEYEKKLTVKSNVTRVEGAIQIINNGTYTIESPLEILQGGNLYTDMTKDIIGIREYDLWVGSTRVTGRNKDNVLGDGKVTYNPETHTLNFDNATIEDYYVRTDDSNAKCNIFAKDIDLKITGKVNLPSTDVKHSIVILSSSTPNISATINADITFSREIWVYGNLTIAGGSLTRTINGSAIYANGTLTIGSGISKIDVMSYIGGYEGITIEDPLVITSPEGLTITNGVTTSIGGLSVYDNTRIVIEHPTVSASYEVTFNTDGGTPVPATQYISDGEKVTKPATDPQKEGWVFDKWCEDEAKTVEFDFANKEISAPIVIYAKYIEEVTITLDVNGGNPFSVTQCKGAKGQTLGQILGDLMSEEPTHPDDKILIGLTKIVDGVETPLSSSGAEDLVINESMTLRLEWGNAITLIDFSATPPTTGAETDRTDTEADTTPGHEGEWIWQSQTNRPILSVPSTGVHYSILPDGDEIKAFWVEGFEEAEIINPFIGAFLPDTQYNVHVFLKIDDDYGLAPMPDENEAPDAEGKLQIKVNGEGNGFVLNEYIDDNGDHIAEICLNIATESNEVKITIDPNGGDALDRPYYFGTKGQSLNTIISEFYDGVEPTWTSSNGTKRFWGFENASGATIYGTEIINSDTTIYCHWRDALTEVNLTVTSPEMGSSTTTEKDGSYWDFDTQTNIPNVTIPSDANYILDNDDGESNASYWVENFVYPEDAFVGTFEAGQTYKAEIILEATGDYVFSETLTVNINGEATGVVVDDDGGWIIVGCEVTLPPAHTVTFHPNGGSVSPTTKEYQEGAKLGTLPVPTRSGYGFVGWYQSTLPARAYAYFRDYYGYDIIRITPHNDINNHNYTHYFRYGDVVYFDVTVNDATVTGLDLNDENTDQYVVSNDGHNIKGYIHLTESAFSRVGSYVLDFVDIHVSNPTYSYTVNDFAVYQNKATSETTVGTEDMVLYAGWTPGASTVSFDTDGGSEIAPQAVKTGAYATRPTEKPVKDGYKFEGWYVDSDFSARFDFSTAITKDTVVYARYVKLIKEVNITAELPKLGETITVEGSIQTPQLAVTTEGEGYSIHEFGAGLRMYWINPTDEGLADGVEIEPDTEYGIILVAVANNGYAFADDVVVKVNGVVTNTFDLGEANEAMQMVATITTDSLKIIGGKDQTHIKGTSDGLTITCNGGFRQFRGLRVGTTELDASAFDSGAGSTIVTLKPDYLNSLELGTYQISFLYQGDRECSTNFTIAKANEPAQGGGGGGQAPAPAATNSPVTGDTITVWILIMTMSGLAMIGIIYNLRRKNR